MQNTNQILLVKPAHFTFNKETAGSNAFQNVLEEKEEIIKTKVLNEFENAVALLKSKNINVTVVEDTPDPVKPDAIFPNNWVSFHADGTVILYPMFAPNRREERRLDVLEMLKKKFKIEKVVDLSKYEAEELFLEGTGSIIFDHQHKVAYACLSPRTDKELFIELCNYL
ncbi:MAG TPA: arginine deiminase-related protein, partial [Bacteroidia bacterium]|nr:arginine deiminase-related protein [Bacteroidia bacterium]